MRLLSGSPGATAFHDWDWLKSSSRALAATFVPLGLFEQGELVGLVPIVIRTRGSVRTVNWVPYPYLGPLCAPDALARCLDALGVWARDQRIAAVRMAFSPQAVVAEADLAEAGFDAATESTMTVSLEGSLDDIRHRMTRTCAKEVRRAIRAGIEVVPADTRDMTVDLPAIIAEAFASRGMPPDYPAAIGTAVAEGLDPRTSETLSARRNGKTIGVVSMLYLGDRAYAWGGGTYRAHRETYANPLLYWELIRAAHKRGCTELDLVGAPDPGIAAFKARFGAEPRPFLVATKMFKRWYRTARSVHGATTRLRFRLRGR